MKCPDCGKELHFDDPGLETYYCDCGFRENAMQYLQKLVEEKEMYPWHDKKKRTSIAVRFITFVFLVFCVHELMHWIRGS